MSFVHLHTHSEYSFLDGGSTLESLVMRAASLGMPAIALTDHDNVCAAVKFAGLCRAYGIQPIHGSEVTMEDETHLTLLAATRAGYANLCRLLTHAHFDGGRLNPHLAWNTLADCADGLIALSGCRKGLVSRLIRAHHFDDARECALRLRGWFGRERLFIELQDDWTPDSHRTCKTLAELADEIGVSAVVTNNVHYALPADSVAHEVLRCVATGTQVSAIDERRPLNAERYLKTAREMTELFSWRPDALASTLAIASMCEAVLPERVEITPTVACPGNQGAGEYLRHLAYKGAASRYAGITGEIRERLEHELSVIIELGFADYFVMVWRIVRWARAHGIRCTGRGSAADSCVAYSLFLTDVDVLARNLPFARFLTAGKLPDIDMDFPSTRRDEVFEHIIGEYGEDRVGMVCTFHTFWGKSAIRDIGKALALPEDVLSFLSKHISPFVAADKIEAAFSSFAELKPYTHLLARFGLLFDLCKRIAGFPRHIGTHSSGIVISKSPLASIAPLQPSARGLTKIWTLDKDDAEAIGVIKFDVLCLRMLSAVEDAEGDIRRYTPSFNYDRIPDDDTPTYNLLQSGKGVGVFQFESAAQLSLAVTLLPSQFEDLVAAVALIRPGPVRGNSVERFVQCRNGYTRADILHPALEEVLRKTYGCIIFQEQVIQVIAAMTGRTDAEADKVRKSLTRHAKMDSLPAARADFVERACARHADLTAERANLLFDMIEGWCGYGFTEGHAASFALTGYRTAYLSVHAPAAFFAGIMSNQPMGFYSANSIASEARRRGVQILPVDINASEDACTAEDEQAIRVGLRLVVNLRQDDIDEIIRAREEDGAFTSIVDFRARVLLHRDRFENLILAGAFDLLHPHRRGLLFALDRIMEQASLIRACREDGVLELTLLPAQRGPLPPDSGGERAEAGLFPGMNSGLSVGGLSLRDMGAEERSIEDFSPWQQYLWSWRMTGVCADCHVFAHFRDSLSAQGILLTYDAQQMPEGTLVRVAGINIRPHRPPTRSGHPVLFSSLEDETDILQLVCFGKVIDRCTRVFLLSPAVIATGIVERKGRGASLRVVNAESLLLRDLKRMGSAPFSTTIVPTGIGDLPPLREARGFPSSRLREEQRPFSTSSQARPLRGE